jgi:hypothetical protein
VNAGLTPIFEKRFFNNPADGLQLDIVGFFAALEKNASMPFSQVNAKAASLLSSISIALVAR